MVGREDQSRAICIYIIYIPIFQEAHSDIANSVVQEALTPGPLWSLQLMGLTWQSEKNKCFWSRNKATSMILDGMMRVNAWDTRRSQFNANRFVNTRSILNLHPQEGIANGMPSKAHICNMSSHVSEWPVPFTLL